ncbi:lysyl-tRNA synthetase, class I [Devosia enhydra]|uniref:Lysine--tRNA ligase n=1 Tax=Devosia enhydra TaxID=665118 RepID=A0A1K2I3D6_9HYPH|nr:lysine--tRNA ligase [Devosia enhydra]SFZ86268.1 lysyl-tRNA synthetase, class I [Devosia enhydra]
MTATLPALDPDFFEPAQTARAWPFEEARKIVKRLEKSGKCEALFETGYGPSGLPHIGTFGEVARTTMVRTAFRLLTRDQVPTRLLCFSDDMDGMRKIPDTVPSKEAMEPHLQKPLTSVPDPWTNQYPSFGAHNNAMLRRFLDTFGFSYEFASATDYYKSGRFDDVLRLAAERYDDIMKVMLPTLGAERQATYSPFLPISPISGRVLYVPMKEVDAVNGTVTFTDEDGRDTTVPVTGGHVKMQWKPDFGMRWAALGVDFEMFGKDHQTNAPIYDRICEILGGKAPEHYVYELFLDAEGQKISKSKGNGLTIDEWLTYAGNESLGLYMFQKPRTAKRLHFDVIPRAVDEYYAFIAAYETQDAAARLENPAFHVHYGAVPSPDVPLSFALLLNLVATANAEDAKVMWGFISRYIPGATPETHPELDKLASYAVRYFNDKVKPFKTYRAPTEQERAALQDLHDRLGAHIGSTDGGALQDLVYEIGKAHGFEPLRDWFKAIYQVLLGDDQGPRFGSFIALYGVDETRKLIADALSGRLHVK